MRSNQFLDLLVILTLAIFAVATGASADFATAGTSLPETNQIDSSDGKTGTAVGDGMTTTGKGIKLSDNSPIKPIDPSLDMTKLGRLDSGPDNKRHYDGSQSTADRLDRDIKDFDAKLGLTSPSGDEGAAGRQPSDRIGRRGTRNAGSTSAAQQQAALRQQQAEQEAATQQQLDQTLGIGTPAPGTTVEAPESTLGATPPVTTSPPDTSLTTELTPSTATGQSTGGQPGDQGASLSESDLATLRSLFFPGGTPATTATQSGLDVDLEIGATLPSDIVLYPLPDAALTSAEAANLGYFYNGQSIVIADFNTRSIVGVVSNGS